MPQTGQPDRRIFTLALAGIVLVTLWRVALLPFNSTDLFVDEAQYWFWGQELAWGYYSKPPLIGWILRLSTDIGGNSPFWVRLPLPLIHAGTAMVMALAGRKLFDARTGAITGLAYISLPGVALGSLLVSTDTPMLFCFALAVLAWAHLMERRSAGWALVLGLAVGTGLLAKYAMVYFPLTAVLAALLLPAARISWRDASIGAVVALAIIAPNLWWNASNDFATLQHTRDNADWEGLQLNAAGLMEFLGGQFAIAGPVLFAAFLAGLSRLRREPRYRYLAMISAPVLLIVSFQALQSGANANWAAAAHIGALLIAADVLRDHKRLLAISFVINLAITAALPVAAVFADSWRMGAGNLVLARHVGQEDISLRAARIASDNDMNILVSDSRTLLADFFWTLRDSGLAVYAAPEEGFPPHHYAQAHALPQGSGDVLFVSRGSNPPDCGGALRIESWQPAEGYYTRDLTAWRVPRSCWSAAN